MCCSNCSPRKEARISIWNLDERPDSRQDSSFLSFFFYITVFLCRFSPSLVSDLQLWGSYMLQILIFKEITTRICQKQNCMDIMHGCGGCEGGGDSEVCQWGTHCSAPEPSPEISGDLLKWDTTRLAGVDQVGTSCRRASAAAGPMHVGRGENKT